MKLHYYLPGAAEPNTCAFMFLPYASTERNASPRLAETARLSGQLIIAAHAPGTNFDFDPRTRQLVRDKDLEGMAEATHDSIQSVVRTTSNFEYVIGWGDSGRASLIATLARLDTSLFDAVLTREGALLQPTSFLRGAWQLLRHGGDRQTSFGDAITDNRPFRRIAAAYAGASGVTEMLAYKDLMCSDAPMGALIDLARTPSVPYYNVGFNYGLAGQPDAVEAFNIALQSERLHAYGSADEGEQRAPILTSIEPWAHGDLISPFGAAKHLKLTAGLLWPLEAPQLGNLSEV